MEIFYLISAVVSLIVLICFFKMGSNLAAIRNELYEIRNENKNEIRRKHQFNYQMNRVLGNKNDAANDLTFILMFDLTNTQLTKSEMQEKYEDFKKRNEARFKELEREFPDYPFPEQAN